jgi:hypothetical protein
MEKASDVLKLALRNLDKFNENYEKFSTYLKSEWYNTVDELQLALDDGRF